MNARSPARHVGRAGLPRGAGLEGATGADVSGFYRLALTRAKGQRQVVLPCPWRETEKVPVVSSAESDNAIVGDCGIVRDFVFQDALAVAFNGQPLTAKLHPYSFATKDDVAVAFPRRPLPVKPLVLIQAHLNAERWRFSHYRKCFRATLGRTRIDLPTRGEKLDIDFLVRAVRARPFWWFLAPRLAGWMPSG